MGDYVSARVVNYVIVTPSDLVNFVIADIWCVLVLPRRFRSSACAWDAPAVRVGLPPDDRGVLAVPGRCCRLSERRRCLVRRMIPARLSVGI